jgi:hypothetical protein
MLLLGAKTATVEGVTVFSDHADPNQFWYLPAPVALGRKSADAQAPFTFIMYKPAVVQSGVHGGGFLMFDVNLQLDKEIENKILSRVSSMAPGQPVLTPVPFDEGTVKCIALDLQGSGGTTATPAPPGAFNAVEKILGASVPSLQGDNDAIFSLTLSQEGAIILKQAYEQGTAPIGVIYDLKFTGLQPALHVKITADFKRIYQHFSASIEGQYYFLKASIEAAFEELVQEGAIKIEVQDFSGTDDQKQQEQWALAFFKDKLLTEWFEPTLTPGEVSGEKSGVPTKPGTTGDKTGGDKTGGDKTGGDKTGGDKTTTTDGGKTGGDKTGTTTGDKGGTTGMGKTGTATGGTATAPQRPAAKFAVDKWDPKQPAGYDVTCTPSTTGTVEKITVTGQDDAIVTVDNVPQQLDSSHQVTIDVAEGSSHDIVVTYPAPPATTETFELLFLLDHPKETWMPGSPGSNPQYLGYLANKPVGADAADNVFTANTAPGSTSPQGADALRDWVQNRLAEPKEVEVYASASWEGRADMDPHNDRLSGRRRDVAQGIIGSDARVTKSDAVGATPAKMVDRRADPHDRIARITGKVKPDGDKITVTAKISRDKAPTANDPGKPDQPKDPGKDQPKDPGKDQPKQPQKTDGDPAIALKLKFLRQEEQKTMVFEFNRQQAVRRTYAPQGFFGLMLQDLQDTEKHFVEVDLDDEFFRVFTVTVDAPIDFQHIGLTSAHVSLDYGDKHGDFIFDPQDHGRKQFQVFMNQNHDTAYTCAVEYHFDPQSGWDGRRFTYQIPAKQLEDRVLSLNPFEDIGFLEVKVFPHDIDAGVIDNVEVLLSHTEPDGQVQEKLMLLAPNSDPQFWRVRIDDPKARSYTYRLTYHLKDGTTRDADPVTTDATALPIGDPFDRPIEVDFIPLFDPKTTRMVFIDVAYADPDNHYRRDERLRLAADTQDPAHLKISVLDPEKRKYQYRLTFVSSTNEMKRGAFVETDDTLVAVAE